jgi:hypothetical protein
MQTLMYRIWTLNYNILIIKPFKFILYVCALVYFALSRILRYDPGDQPVLTDGVPHHWSWGQWPLHQYRNHWTNATINHPLVQDLFRNLQPSQLQRKLHRRMTLASNCLLKLWNMKHRENGCTHWQLQPVCNRTNLLQNFEWPKELERQLLISSRG